MFTYISTAIISMDNLGVIFYVFLSPFMCFFKMTSKGLYHFMDRKSSQALFIQEDNDQMAENEVKKEKGEKTKLEEAS